MDGQNLLSMAKVFCLLTTLYEPEVFQKMAKKSQNIVVIALPEENNMLSHDIDISSAASKLTSKIFESLLLQMFIETL